MGPTTAFRRACALLTVLALASCTTVPEQPPVVAKPAEPAVVPAKPPAPPPKPKPAPPPPKESEPTPPPAPPPPPGKPVDALRRAQQLYDDGEYKEAARQFQRALEQGLASPADQASAHKHLAFMACVARRTPVCRAEFRRAFEADAAFDLTPAEAGHPMWGPVFRSVKAEIAKKRKAAAPAAKPPATSR